MVNIILADNQDITQAGMMYILSKMGYTKNVIVQNKTELINMLKDSPKSIVIIDYTLFDIPSFNDLYVMGLRFADVIFILWSEELSLRLLRKVVNVGIKVSILFKDFTKSEIQECIKKAVKGSLFVCKQAKEMLIEKESSMCVGQKRLTKTETEILIDIAQGLTTKEIANKRYSSFHTINTHRKNIFRKLSVNTAHEATRYALRAGLLDITDYSI
ncbi:response regulator transcription factor [Prevotella amnii]|uniref:response regulator transcription factor n=1 Tax=Prevotella amnii TaxID=419005 RepID=UPI003369F760